MGIAVKAKEWTVKNMSYDIRIGVKVEGADCFAVVAEPEFASPTYNLRDMFVACMDWDYEQGEWYRCTDALPKLERGLRELTLNREKYTQFNPPNGWGSIDSAKKAIASVIECIKNETGSAWSWNEIPLECLYMRW